MIHVKEKQCTSTCWALTLLIVPFSFAALRPSCSVAEPTPKPRVSFHFLSLLLPPFPSLFLLLPLYSIGVPGGRGAWEAPCPHAGSAPAPIKILKLPLSECLFCSVRLSLREPQTPPTPAETLAVSNGGHGPEFLGAWGEIYNRGPLIIIVVVIKINNNIWKNSTTKHLNCIKILISHNLYVDVKPVTIISI